jgi:hypothetical protein
MKRFLHLKMLKSAPNCPKLIPEIINFSSARGSIPGFCPGLLECLHFFNQIHIDFYQTCAPWLQVHDLLCFH